MYFFFLYIFCSVFYNIFCLLFRLCRCWILFYIFYLDVLVCLIHSQDYLRWRTAKQNCNSQREMENTHGLFLEYFCVLLFYFLVPGSSFFFYVYVLRLIWSSNWCCHSHFNFAIEHIWFVIRTGHLWSTPSYVFLFLLFHSMFSLQ